MSHLHAIIDADNKFLICPITRAITPQKPDKTTLIQHDHNSERFTFEIPRFIEGHDMSECNKIEIHFINISKDAKNKSEDVYLVNDLTVFDDNVIFSWLISNNATKHAGTLNFLVRFSCLTESTVDYAWHTDIHKGIFVGKGMNNGKAVLEDHSDILEAWKLETLGAIETAISRANEAANKVEFLLAEIEPSIVQINEGGIE